MIFIIIISLAFLCVAMWGVDAMANWSKKIHYRKEGSEKFLCGKRSGKYDQESKVNCKKCLYILRKEGII